ncbi:MFS general substrate transporter [Athelia psychrophila]|uniref:MFS general substrate transporter n=1 Tax=Athelia psychrophila TaxID=1759441 RepID=A0A166WY87_9AGAM|nr:MFS general substrate transporter [Fibularhizoctonia sp. CBS 109695]
MVHSSEVSIARRGAQVACAVFFCFTCAGIIFGFAALKPVLVSEGVYSDLCPTRDQDANGNQPVPCREQDLRLNFMFTIATVVTNVAALPIGYILDRIGPQRTSILGGTIFALGCFCFGLGIRTPGFDSYAIGYVVIAIGSPLIFLSQFHLSNAFPVNSGLILSLIIGSFDASSLPMVAYREIYYASGGWLTSRAWFWGYAFLGLFVILEQLFLAPRTVYTRGDDSVKDLSEPAPTERTGLLADAGERDQDHLPDEIVSSDPLTGKLFGYSAGSQIWSSWFWIVTAFLCVHMLRINLYIQTAHSQLLYYTGDPALADSLIRAFTYLLPLGGIVGIPFVGYLLDKRCSRDAFVTLAVFGVLFGALGMGGSAGAQVAGITVLVILRPLMYTAVSDYAAKTFGFQTFGTVYGLANTLSGLFGLVQWPLDVLVKLPLDGNYSPVNAALLVAGLVTSTALASRIWLGTRR